MKSAGLILSKLPFYPIFFQIFKIGFFAEIGSLVHPSCQEKRIFRKCYQNFKKRGLIAEKMISLSKETLSANVYLPVEIA